MKSILPPFYTRLLMVAIVLGPIVWLLFTEDGRRRSDLVLLYLFGKAEINPALEHWNAGMTEQQVRELFPKLDLVCRDGANPFGDRLCAGEIGAYNQVPARSFTLFLRDGRLRAVKVDYRRSYHAVLHRQLARRVGPPAEPAEGPPPEVATWPVDDGVLLLPVVKPASEDEAVLLWLSGGD